MPNIKDLNFDEIALVSGGEGHGTEVNRERQEARNSVVRNAPTYIYSDPNTVKCANNVLGGLVSGIPKGPGGMISGVVGGAIKGDCLGSSNSKSNGCNSGSSKCSGSNAASTCNR
ncbi:hypothetical protein [Enterobacter sp. CC120223-11]|uniref:hypothetical protein n=1 Tax=Enterobacter sp. CC120223-11 TaxID=1378073 RepID=UPI000BE274A8|nr:hypothetical protein [Enterobacter sp. CC120223-11]